MTEWIDVKKRLPELYVDVVCMCKNLDGLPFAVGDKYYSIDRLAICENETKPDFVCHRINSEVLAWMPLPPIPVGL
jgi:hypothetical protein